jgi:hypothetical protein
MLTRRSAAALLAVLALAACGGDSTPLPTSNAAPSLRTAERPGDPRFLRHERGVNTPHSTATMWAVRGQERSMTIRYPDGTPHVTFRVGPQTLERDAAGRPLAAGDSVQITMRLVNPSVFAVEMQPAGIRFAADAPAQLEFNLARAGRAAVRSNSLAMWRQEARTGPWELIPATFDFQRQTATAPIPGLTIYAIIY